MATTSVRINHQTHSRLKQLADREHKPIGQIVADAIEKYENETFWQEAREAYACLRADPEAWKSYQEETELWDTTSLDGLEKEEPYFTESELRDVLESDSQER